MNSICTACRHFLGPIDPNVTPTCAAFPEGIPDEVLNNGSHHVPFPGDQEIRFEAMSKAERTDRVQRLGF